MWMRLLGAGLLAAPSAEAGTMVGTVAGAAAVHRKRRRLLLFLELAEARFMDFVVLNCTRTVKAGRSPAVSYRKTNGALAAFSFEGVSSAHDCRQSRG
jgi:hypothetical protein